MNENWYKNAILYAVDVARFADSNGDGVGDFPGLTERLPYLADLGITCLWLLPCYPSPDRDNGYDVADYYNLDPRLGTFDDFLKFLHKAGEFGIQVLLDLVVNHTSDEHPWFRAARWDDHSGFREWYVWTNRPPPLDPGEKTMFPGQENSVWAYDEVARAFYYHQFYSFEPNLNLANPRVQAEVRQIMDFWLSFGISGFRLDAAAPMIQKKGLPGTQPRDPHAVLREMFDYQMQRRPGSALLGEVDVEPEMLKSFFDEGGQMNLMFNFVLNNYAFLALATGRADVLLRGIRKLPRLPESGQWVNFLRNLDELDLERLTPEERQRVMDVFAPDADMRIFGRGIRRRLAPMLDGDQRRIEMAFSLLFSLPGTPMIVYGDEIGMGEDLEQAGRNAVRAPMQWSPGKNAGFSRAAADKLVQRVIASGPFSYKAVNVADQSGAPGSLLERIKHFIALRRQHPAMAEAAWHALDVADKGVLAYGYNTGSSLLVMLHNLTDEPRSATLDLGVEETPRLTNLFSGHEELLTGDRCIELAPYDYRWYIHHGL